MTSADTSAKALTAALAQVPALCVLVYLVFQFIGYVEASESRVIAALRDNTAALVRMEATLDEVAEGRQR